MEKEHFAPPRQNSGHNNHLRHRVPIASELAELDDVVEIFLGERVAVEEVGRLFHRALASLRLLNQRVRHVVFEVAAAQQKKKRNS